MVQPGLGRRVTVLLRDLGGGEMVEGPHALVGSGRAAQRDRAQGHQGSGTDGLHGSLTGKTGQRNMRAKAQPRGRDSEPGAGTGQSETPQLAGTVCSPNSLTAAVGQSGDQPEGLLSGSAAKNGPLHFLAGVRASDGSPPDTR